MAKKASRKQLKDVRATITDLKRMIDLGIKTELVGRAEAKVGGSGTREVPATADDLAKLRASLEFLESEEKRMACDVAEK
jgi:hypothetical protein